VFAGEGRQIGLLPHEVNFYSRSLQVLSKQPLKGSVFRSVGGLWHTSVPPSDLPLKRTMDIREPSFDQTGIFASGFLCIANYPMDFTHGVHAADHDMRQLQSQELVFEPR
jgi:hypothetical protein